MTGKARVFLILVLLMVGGCASRPVFSVEIYGTPTPFQLVDDPYTATAGYLTMVPSHATVPVVTITPTTLPAFTPAASPVQDFSPILYGKKYDANTFFLVLGGVQGGKWLSPDQAAALITGTSEYDIYPFANEAFQVLGYAPETAPIHPGQYFVGTDVAVNPYGMVGVAHGWPVRQGKAEELSPENELYQRVVLDCLKQQGISTPQQGNLHIFRVDLEGDGVDEIFISASHLDESQHITRAGDYSVVLMRKVVGNEAVTLPVVADIYQSTSSQITYPSTYSLGNFIDLDRDGVLEVVVDVQRWEQDGALIYRIEGQEVVQIS